MWHARHAYTSDEKEILKELEYDLFMCNPGFRGMWQDNFDEFFEALFDERKWEQREEEREKEIEEHISRRMIEDPEYHEFMKERAIIEGVIEGDIKIEHAPVEMRPELEEMMKELEEDQLDRENGFDAWAEKREREENADELLKLAKSWSIALSKIAAGLYEETKILDLFRISVNCLPVLGKIVGAKAIDYDERNEDFYDLEWRMDRIDYNLSLASLRRCLESLEKLKINKEISKKIDVEKFLAEGKIMQQELIDRLDKIEQLRFTKPIKLK